MGLRCPSCYSTKMIIGSETYSDSFFSIKKRRYYTAAPIVKCYACNAYFEPVYAPPVPYATEIVYKRYIERPLRLLYHERHLETGADSYRNFEALSIWP